MFTEGVRYKFNDIVKHGSNLYLAKVEHVATATFNLSNYDLFLKVIQFEAEWDSETEYQEGDIRKWQFKEFGENIRSCLLELA